MKFVERLAARFPSLANTNLDSTNYAVRVRSARRNPLWLVLRKVLTQLVLMPFYLLLAVPLALAGSFVWLLALDRDERRRLHDYCNRFWYYPSLCIHKVHEGLRFRSVTVSAPSVEIGCEDGSMSVLHFPGTIFEMGVEYVEANRPVEGVHREVVIAGLPNLPVSWAGRFRSVALVHVIDHIPGLDPALVELRRITAPGGRVSLSGFMQGYPGHLAAVTFGRLTVCWLEKNKGLHHFLTEEQWRARFARAGFRVLRFEPFLGGLRGRLWVVLHTVFEINGSNDLFYAADRFGLALPLIRRTLLTPLATALTAFFMRAPARTQPCHFFAELEAAP